MSLIDIESERQTNPVDAVEMIASRNDWTFDRSAEDEITVSVGGQWCDYHLSFSWMEEVEALHLAAALDLKVAETRKTEVARLLALINEQLWLGHFDLWDAEGVIMFRYVLLLGGGAEPSDEQLEGMLETAIELCERYYQAFQFVVWGGRNAKEAVEAALIETAGEA